MSNQTKAGAMPVAKTNPYAKICGVEIKTYEEFLAEVNANHALLTGWNKLPEAGKQKIKQYYDGESLPPFTSDPIFKYIFDPYTHPERLSELLSQVIGIPCKVKKALSLENIPLSLYSKKVIMDILVELETGELANVEIQWVVADFSAKRAAVLSSSLITRQYSILKEQMKADMDFEQIEKVYTVVFFEDNIPECKDCPDHYIHKSKQTFNTGIKMDLMQEFSSFQSICSDAIMFLNDKKVMLSMILEGLTEMDENSFKNMIKRRDAQVAELKQTVIQKDAEINALKKLLEKAVIKE